MTKKEILIEPLFQVKVIQASNGFILEKLEELTVLPGSPPTYRRSQTIIEIDEYDVIGERKALKKMLYQVLDALSIYDAKVTITVEGEND